MTCQVLVELEEQAVRAELQAAMDRDLYGDLYEMLNAPAPSYAAAALEEGNAAIAAAAAAAAAPAALPATDSPPMGRRGSVAAMALQNRGKRRMTIKDVSKAAAPLATLRKMMIETRAEGGVAE